ncbi:penicillin-binding protein 2 [Candidatus Uhrbacteria bacterium]|nr:penicillin-binding protein 2 [Candidatus Uhrbacteria bacterium]
MRNDFIPSFLDIDPDTNRIRPRDRTEWVESSFDDTGRAASQEFLGVSIPDRAIRFFFICCALIFFIFFLRAAYLQIVLGHGFVLLAEKNKIKDQLVLARRGVIYDAQGKPLVWNVPTFTVHVTPAELPADPRERKDEIERLAALLSTDRSALDAELANARGYQPVIVADNIEYEKSLSLAIFLKEFKGVTLQVAERRQYITSTSTQSVSHVIGYTGRISAQQLAERDGYSFNDVIGKEGLEISYESALHGLHGTKSIEVDALGREKRVLNEIKPRDGKNLKLTIDFDLQREAERALRSTLDRMRKKRGVVIITDPVTGGIKSLVSLPAYDNNAFVIGLSRDAYKTVLSDPNQPLFNRAIYGEYPSGSTIKPIVAAAALEEKVATEKTVVRSVGGIRVGQWSFPDWKAGGHGATNVVKAIAESVNTYFYAIGGGYGDIKGLGVDRLVSYFKKFGLGGRVGIDLLGERSGFVPTREWKEEKTGQPWYIGDTYHIAIGQGDIVVTPLQVNAYTNYFANGGKNYVPHLVSAVEDISTGVRTEVQPAVFLHDLVASDTVSVVRAGMRRTVTDGSARRLSTLPITAAGKTGTAQWRTGKDPHAWFTGWAPYEHPELVITVLIEEGEEGSRSASPVAYDILKWYAEHRVKGIRN